MAWAGIVLFTCVTIIKGCEKWKVGVEYLRSVFFELPQTTKSNAMPLAFVVLERARVHACSLLCISFKMWKHLTTEYSDVCFISRATWGNESPLTINILFWFQPIFQLHIQWMWTSYRPIITSCNILYVQETVFFTVDRNILFMMVISHHPGKTEVHISVLLSTILKAYVLHIMCKLLTVICLYSF